MKSVKSEAAVVSHDGKSRKAFENYIARLSESLINGTHNTTIDLMQEYERSLYLYISISFGQVLEKTIMPIVNDANSTEALTKQIIISKSGAEIEISCINLNARNSSGKTLLDYIKVGFEMGQLFRYDIKTHLIKRGADELTLDNDGGITQWRAEITSKPPKEVPTNLSQDAHKLIDTVNAGNSKQRTEPIQKLSMHPKTALDYKSVIMPIVEAPVKITPSPATSTPQREGSSFKPSADFWLLGRRDTVQPIFQEMIKDVPGSHCIEGEGVVANKNLFVGSIIMLKVLEYRLKKEGDLRIQKLVILRESMDTKDQSLLSNILNSGKIPEVELRCKTLPPEFRKGFTAEANNRLKVVELEPTVPTFAPSAPVALLEPTCSMTLMEAVQSNNTPVARALLSKSSVNIEANNRLKVVELEPTVPTFAPSAPVALLELTCSMTLMQAVQLNNVPVAQALLSKGSVNIDEVTFGLNAMRVGVTPLHFAIIMKHSEMIELLLAYGANSNKPTINFQQTSSRQTSQQTSLMLAALNEDIKTCTRLLEYKAEVNKAGANHETPLLIAAQHQNTDLMKLFLNYNASVKMANASGESPLHNAVTNCTKADAAALLLEHRAEINVTNTNDQTPLHYAVWQSSAEVVSFLIEQNANIETISPLATTGISHTRHLQRGNALYHAVDSSNEDVVRMLIDKNADVNALRAEYAIRPVPGGGIVYTELNSYLSAIETAAKNGCATIVDTLMSSTGINPKYITKSLALVKDSSIIESLLMDSHKPLIGYNSKTLEVIIRFLTDSNCSAPQFALAFDGRDADCHELHESIDQLLERNVKNITELRGLLTNYCSPDPAGLIIQYAHLSHSPMIKHLLIKSKGGINAQAIGSVEDVPRAQCAIEEAAKQDDAALSLQDVAPDDHGGMEDVVPLVPDILPPEEVSQLMG